MDTSRPLKPFRVVISMLMLLAVTTSLGAQEDAAGELRRAGIGHLRAGEFEAAADAYAGLTELTPDDPQAWAFLGLAQRNLGRDSEAELAFDRALELDGDNVTALNGKAILLEARGEVATALEMLERSAALGGVAPAQLTDNPAFEGLRRHDGFAAVVETAERRSSPCQFGGPYDDFDFWVGDWDVTVGEQKVAENRITKEMNGCIVRESYSTGAYQGESINYFDPETGNWKQNWVDVGGGITRYEGGLAREGVMRMEGANATADGSVELARVTWTARDDGTVHHLIERSKDDGASWTVIFDAIYVLSESDEAASSD